MVIGLGIAIGLLGAVLPLLAVEAAVPVYGAPFVRNYRAIAPVAAAAGCTALAASLVPAESAAGWAVAAGLLGLLALAAVAFLVRTGDAANKEHDSRLHVRMWDIRSQVHRLQNRDHIEARLARQAEVHGILDRYGYRFESILVAIEHHLMLGDPDRAERIITLFARHLRNLLFEGSVPFLALKTSLEHMRVHLRLMGELTDHRISWSIDESLPAPSDRERYTESLHLTPWAEAVTWPLFELAERSVHAASPARLHIALSGRTLVCSCDFDGTPVGNPIEVKLLGDGHAPSPLASAAHEIPFTRASATVRTRPSAFVAT
jgi:hypothetical protein